MTYAAQVRSVNKVVANKTSQDEACDINSLTIICKYFVGSLVKIKTLNEEFEGILHTLYQNKVCLSLVTTSQFNFPYLVINMEPSKMINLTDIISVSASNVSEQQDVTIKGKLIHFPVITYASNIVNNNLTNHPIANKVDSKKEDKANGSSKLKYANVLTKSQSVNQKPGGVIKSNGTPSKEQLNVCPEKPAELAIQNSGKENNDQISTTPIESNDSKGEEEDCNSVKSDSSKKLNPNAPEFKPRFFNTNYPPVLLPGDMNLTIFPPPTVQSPPIISPNTISSAVFIPNYILLNSQQLAAQQSTSDVANNASSETTSNITTDIEIPIISSSSATINQTSPTSVMPMYSPISFFVPNTSIVQMSPQTNHSNTITENLYSPHTSNQSNPYPMYTNTHSKVAPRHLRMSESSSDDCNIQISHNVAYNMGPVKKWGRNGNSNTSNDTAHQNAPEFNNLSDWPPLPVPNGNVAVKSTDNLE